MLDVLSLGERHRIILNWITAKHISERLQCHHKVFMLQMPVLIALSVTVITYVSIFKSIDECKFYFSYYSFIFNYALIFLARRNSSLPLWDTLFICNDCGFVPSKDGALHTDIPKATGKTLKFRIFAFYSSLLFKIVAFFFNVVTLPDKKPCEVFSHKSSQNIVKVEFHWTKIDK